MRSDLQDVFTRLAKNLARAVHDRRSPFRIVTLATQARTGPRARMVVLRAADLTMGHVVLHSDTRAQKIQDIGQVPEVALVFWDPRHRQQLRASGQARISPSEATRALAWQRLSAGAQAQYASDVPPGTPREAPGPSPGRNGVLPQDVCLRVRDHFALIEVSLASLDWLSLDRGGHRRAVFTRQEGVWTGTWVEP